MYTGGGGVGMGRQATILGVVGGGGVVVVQRPKHFAKQTPVVMWVFLCIVGQRCCCGRTAGVVCLSVCRCTHNQSPQKACMGARCAACTVQ